MRVQPKRDLSTSRAVAAFGSLAALAGIEHGIGEFWQGVVSPATLVFPSWPDTEAFTILAGEPAMALLPNLAVAGVATLVVSSLLGVVALRFADRVRGALALLLLVGGGFGLPVIGVLVSLAALNAQRTRRSPPGPLLRALARHRQAFLAAGVASYLGLVPGVPVLSQIAGLQSTTLVLMLIVLAFGGLVLALVSADAHDRLLLQLTNPTLEAHPVRAR